MRYVDLTGRRYGRLVVKEMAWKENPKEKRRRSLAKCQCDCGRETVVFPTNLTRGLTTSCGCYSKERIRAYNQHRAKGGGVR